MAATTEGTITLYQVDTTMLGGPVFYFSSSGNTTRDIVLGGNTYIGLPMDASGFEYSTRGAIPQPNFTFSNLFGAGNTLIADYKGLVGAIVKRIVTLERFLDDGSSPDPNAFIVMDEYVVSQKTSHNAVIISFKLSAKFDQEGTKIPRRVILRDVCSHVYRRWNGTAFDYSKATCPYTGSATFDVNDVPSTNANDMCSRFLTGCEARFVGLPLPSRAFPGVGRVK